MHSAHDYIVSIWSTSSCPVHIKHSNRQLPRDRSMAVPQIARLTLKERGSEKRPYELHFCCYKFCMVMVVSDDLRGTLRWSKFQHASSPPRKCCSLYLHWQLHTTHATPPPLYMYAYPFFNLWIHPCFPYLSTLMYMTVATGSPVYSHRWIITKLSLINLIEDLPKINHLNFHIRISPLLLRVCIQGEWWWWDFGGAGTLPPHCYLEERTTDASRRCGNKPRTLDKLW